MRKSPFSENGAGIFLLFRDCYYPNMMRGMTGTFSISFSLHLEDIKIEKEQIKEKVNMNAIFRNPKFMFFLGMILLIGIPSYKKVNSDPKNYRAVLNIWKKEIFEHCLHQYFKRKIKTS
jgi:hypothetical protein